MMLCLAFVLSVCSSQTEWLTLSKTVSAKTMSQCQSVEVVAFSKTGQVALSKAG